MTDYLPEVYQQFSSRFPAVKEAFDALGAAEHAAGPLGEKERRLIKLGIAVGAESEGAVRSHVRKLLGVGASQDEILHAIVLALTTIGFPATNAALGWAEEVLAEVGRQQSIPILATTNLRVISPMEAYRRARSM